MNLIAALPGWRETGRCEIAVESLRLRSMGRVTPATSSCKPSHAGLKSINLHFYQAAEALIQNEPRPGVWR